jgi:hypothetical protein
MAVSQAQKILDAFVGAGDDFNKNFELFRSICGAPRS